MTAFSARVSSSTNRYRNRRQTQQIAAYAVLLVAAVIFLYPMGLMVINSFKSNAEMYINPAGMPQQWSLASYGEIFQYHGGLWLNFINSIIIATISTVLAVFLCAMAGFSFAKYRFKGRNAIFALLLATMMVPPEVVIPGQYILFARLQWINSLRVQILPTVTPILGLFLIRQYMLTIPNELIEAARIDGAGHLVIFWRIMVPTSAPVLGAYSILHFLMVWNAYIWPTLVATKNDVKPIMVVLPQLVDPNIGFLPVWGTIMAGCVLSTLPLLIVFVIFQDKFMTSVVVGALKE